MKGLKYLGILLACHGFVLFILGVINFAIFALGTNGQIDGWCPNPHPTENKLAEGFKHYIPWFGYVSAAAGILGALVVSKLVYILVSILISLLTFY